MVGTCFRIAYYHAWCSIKKQDKRTGAIGIFVSEIINKRIVRNQRKEFKRISSRINSVDVRGLSGFDEIHYA